MYGTVFVCVVVVRLESIISELPIGLLILGVAILQSEQSSIQLTQARKILTAWSSSNNNNKQKKVNKLFLIELNKNGSAVSSSSQYVIEAGIEKELSIDCIELLSADSAAVEHTDLIAFYASYSTQFIGGGLDDFTTQFDALKSSLTSLSSSSSSSSSSPSATDVTVQNLAFEIQSNKSLIASSEQGRIISSEELASSDESNTITTSVWNVLSDENPLVVRKKAANKKAASSSSSSSASGSFAPVAVLSLPDYAVEIGVLQCMSAASSSSSSAFNAPTLVYNKSSKEGLKILQVNLSVIAVVSSPTTSLYDVLKRLSVGLLQQCDAMQTKVEAEYTRVTSFNKKNGVVSNSYTIQSLHFQPYGFAHSISDLFFSQTPVTPRPFENDTKSWFLTPPSEEEIDAIHPNWILSAAEDSLLKQRETLHQLWGIKLNTPSFRIRNALSFPMTPSLFSPLQFIVQPRLLNVHEHIFSFSKDGIVSHSGVVNGELSIVQGHYAYYHYLQDKLQDNGWGCAYRTLQTICSFFVLQGYSQSVPIPTIQNIQEMLVSLKDKEQRFIGSKEWIGSMEVGLVLNYCYGVQCKTLFVSSGSEVNSHARAFALHFNTQGTPIMIGGGVLAYGLLGIDYNQHTGDVRYLILDPHYTGSDSISPMLKGGWIGWKKSDLFLSDHFYNFAMPQRPNTCV